MDVKGLGRMPDFWVTVSAAASESPAAANLNSARRSAQTQTELQSSAAAQPPLYSGPVLYNISGCYTHGIGA